MTKEEKQTAIDMLSEAYDKQWPKLNSIEPRLRDYIYDVCTFDKSHNAYEILGALKFLRLLNTYEQDTDTFRDVIYKYEGTWQKCDGVWQHIEGGLKHPGTTGPMYYRLQPFQVFVLASMFLLRVWINTEAEAGTRELLPTEQVRDGSIYDLRREVQQRQYLTNADGTFQYDFMGRLINRLDKPSTNNPSITVMDELRNWVNQYKSLQQ